MGSTYLNSRLFENHTIETKIKAILMQEVHFPFLFNPQAYGKILDLLSPSDFINDGFFQRPPFFLISEIVSESWIRPWHELMWFVQKRVGECVESEYPKGFFRKFLKLFGENKSKIYFET